MKTSKDLLQARQSAKRSRVSIACSPCKSAKTKCSTYRPCSRCLNATVGCNNDLVTRIARSSSQTHQRSPEINTVVGTDLIEMNPANEDSEILSGLLTSFSRFQIPELLRISQDRISSFVQRFDVQTGMSQSVSFLGSSIFFQLANSSLLANSSNLLPPLNQIEPCYNPFVARPSPALQAPVRVGISASLRA